MAEFLGRQIKARFTEEEHEQVAAIAANRGVTPGRLVRDIVLDRLRTNLTHGERLQLVATCELRQVYMDVLEASLAKQMTPAKLSEIEDSAKARRPELLLAFMEEMA